MGLFKSKKESKEGFISAQEVRRISIENKKIIREYEKKRNRKVIPREEYVTKMEDEQNLVEFDNLHTYFFSDSGWGTDFT